MTHLAPGDYVESIGLTCFPDHTRTWVISIEPVSHGFCSHCGPVESSPLNLSIMAPYGVLWCPNHWRKIGGDFEEAKRRERVEA